MKAMGWLGFPEAQKR